MGEDRRHGGREAEAVGDHVLVACFAEFVPVEPVPVKDVADERLGRGNQCVGFLQRRAGGEPPSGRDVLLDAQVVGGVILLHHHVPVRAGEVERIAGVFLEEAEILPHCRRDIFPDRRLVIPPPLGVQVAVAHGIECCVPRQIGRLLGRIVWRGSGRLAGER